MHVQVFCKFSQCPFTTPFQRFPFSSSQSSQNFAAQFCTTPRSHLTPLKIFAEPLFSLFSTITLVESRRLHATQTQSQFHTRSWCPDTCRPLRFPSILVLCQEEATREPCLQSLGLLPIQLLMQMILLQLHAATFSVLQRRTQLNICWRWSLSRHSRFSWHSSPCTLCKNILRISDCILGSLGHLTLGTCLFTVSSSFRGPHIRIRLFHACKICEVDKDMIRGSHKQHCINSTRWDFETTLIWIQIDGSTPRNQKIISHQWRNVTWSDAWRKTHLFSINRPTNTKLLEPLFHQSTQEHEVS